MDVLIDTNILLDVLIKRQPFYGDSARVWTLAEQGRIRGHIAAISFNNVYYIVRKLAGRKAAEQSVGLLRDVFLPVAMDAQLLNQAIDGSFTDFEDAIQYHSAVRADARCIITRNPGHFPESSVAAITPDEFLVAHASELS